MTIDEIPSFDKDSAIGKLTDMWGWLGVKAAESILDAIAGDIQSALEVAA